MSVYLLLVMMIIIVLDMYIYLLLLLLIVMIVIVLDMLIYRSIIIIDMFIFHHYDDCLQYVYLLIIIIVLNMSNNYYHDLLSHHVYLLIELYLIRSGTLCVWLPSVIQFPAKPVPRVFPYSLLSAMAPCVSTDTPLAIRRRGSSRHPWGRTVNRALGRPSSPSPERAGPTANHMCDGVAWPESQAALKICSASSWEEYRSRTWKNKQRKYTRDCW